MTIGNVYRDPKGKTNRAGEQEHCFIVRRGSFVDIMRYENEDKANVAREEMASC